jgi:hypothetical protein
VNIYRGNGAWVSDNAGRWHGQSHEVTQGTHTQNRTQRTATKIRRRRTGDASGARVVFCSSLSFVDTMHASLSSFCSGEFPTAVLFFAFLQDTHQALALSPDGMFAVPCATVISVCLLVMLSLRSAASLASDRMLLTVVVWSWTWFRLGQTNLVVYLYFCVVKRP